MRAENTLFEVAADSNLRVIAYRPDYIGPTREEAHIGQNVLYWFFAPVGAAVVAGPACLEWRPLRAGRHRVGRAPGNDLCIDDPDVELHHGLLDVAADGSVSFTQLTGRVPVPIGPAAKAIATASSREPWATAPPIHSFFSTISTLSPARAR